MSAEQTTHPAAIGAITSVPAAAAHCRRVPAVYAVFVGLL
jgi:hypothetical protein